MGRMSAPFRAALADALDSPPWILPAVRELRGIVIPAGGELYGRLAWNLVTTLRGLGCTLPIEIWHLADEMPDDMAAVFTDAGCRLVDADATLARLGIRPRSVDTEIGRGRGWWLKAVAVRHTGFAEVLLLDADNVPARDPTYLFDDKAYARPGAYFWPDLPPSANRSEWVPAVAWRNVGLDPVCGARPFESGQLMVDRRRHLHALDICVLLNEWRDYVYQFVYGDKDCWLLAWHLAGSEYGLPKRNPAYRHPAICQHDAAGELVFQHCCNGKEDLAAGKVIAGVVSRRFAPDAAASFAEKRRRHREKQAFVIPTPSGIVE
jgi:hypothetical protein